MSTTANKKRKLGKDMDGSSSSSPSNSSREDEDATVRCQLITEHERLREMIRQKHTDEMNEFEKNCLREQYEGFNDCVFVMEARAKIEKEKLGNKCSICKTKTGTMKCLFCEISEQSIYWKCDTCAWPLACTKKDHGFCASCVEIVALSPEDFDIPRRLNQARGYKGDDLERDHLHPFVICDCGICAFCGEDDYTCCVDHRDHLCSCYPEMF
jgi:hypothetical protein